MLVRPLVVLGLLIALLPAGSAAAQTPGRVLARAIAVDRPALGRYWSARRLAAATPTRAPRRAAAATPAAGRGQVLSRPTVAATPFGGVADVGTIAYIAGGHDHRATASVVTSPRRNLIVTAAHVLLNARDAVFIPRYHDGVKPFGDWLIGTVYIDHRFVSSHDINLDVALATVKVRNGRTLQSVVGADGLVTSRGFTNRVRVIGYPAQRYQPAGRDEPVHCSATTHRLPGYADQVEFDCAGYPDGTSGSPWLLDYDSRTGHAYTNGVIGGYDQGGPSASVSTTSYFGPAVKALYAAAMR